jgi:nucleoside-diphosphate-sugar epimerase
VDGGLQMRCFTDISDAISALIKIIENENDVANQQIFNIGNPYNELSIKELAHMMVKLAKNYDKVKDLAEKTTIISANAADYYGKSYQDIQRRVPSIEKAETMLGWTPTMKIKESLIKIMDYYFL